MSVWDGGGEFPPDADSSCLKFRRKALLISLTEAVPPEGRHGHKEKPSKQNPVRVSTPLSRGGGKAPAS